MHGRRLGARSTVRGVSDVATPKIATPQVTLVQLSLQRTTLRGSGHLAIPLTEVRAHPEHAAGVLYFRVSVVAGDRFKSCIRFTFRTPHSSVSSVRPLRSPSRAGSGGSMSGSRTRT